MALKQGFILLCCVLTARAAVLVGKHHINYFYNSFVEDFSRPVEIRFGREVTFKNCTKNDDVTVGSLDINPCSEEPCIFHKGSTVSVTVVFTPLEEVKSGELSVDAIAFGHRLPMVRKENICEGHGVTCPLEKGKKQTFTINQKVEMYYPPLPIDVEAYVENDNRKILCIRFKAVIKN
ncbi:NPC intracellular cholesterol transporter 2-like [Acropora palmata]|uniref:NPC intracellular cholesterol transporter 2-like n=1 Tax=Acropora palmata TaxID=6131 RepID=UPI003D9FD8FD